MELFDTHFVQFRQKLLISGTCATAALLSWLSLHSETLGTLLHKNCAIWKQYTCTYADVLSGS